MHRHTAIDLFCGAGGVTEALKQYFDILCAIEFDPIIAKTYALNHSDNHLIEQDIRTISKEHWLSFTKIKPGELDLLVGTPPCQGFSRHSRKKIRENKDGRNKLIMEVFKVANLFQPKFILFENVDNIINFEMFHLFLDAIINLNNNGYKRFSKRPSYHVRFEIVDASNYEVPQKRKRLILIAKRIDQFPNTAATLSFSPKSVPVIKDPLAIWPEKRISTELGKYLGMFNLKPLAAGETDPDDELHTAGNLSELNLKRIKATPQDGGSRDAWPEELLLDCHKKSNVSYKDVYGRMDSKSYAPTITCGCTKYSKGRFGHPTQDRAISLREAALIQTFPLNYQFTGNIEGIPYKGSKENIATQIGNAVPVNLAKAFVKEIANHLDKEKGYHKS
ncbi:DNA cytosine methyltransferase [Aneurinibacillus aneurinilyticus]|uniref:Cytosine-specific methyltransferase n=1 Tax=Aneurinibacillus aneurinilyticus TaxID=1391 RepID=A0A848D2Z4_ANEAE|nr:DNA cytosine methyltransferase [Aneurinibacillus aneurinilyticus]NMF01150.1 DNA cytosine methyltransferase [Aneurinibacillus aneurinilyticus]